MECRHADSHADSPMASPSAPPAQQHELPWPAGGAQASSSLDEAQRQQQAEHGHADGAAPSGCPASEHADDHCTAWQLATAEAAAGALRQYGGGRGDGMLRAPMPFVQQLTASEAGASLHRLLTPCTVPVPMPLMRHAHSMEPYQPMEHHHGRHLLPHNCGSTPSPRSSIDEHGHMSVGGWSRGTDAPATAAPMPLHPLPLPGPTVLCCKRTANGLVDGGPELARLSLERSHSASTAVLMGGSRNGGASLDRDPRQHGAQRGSGGGGGQQQQQPGSSATFGTVSSDHYRQQQQQQQQRAGNGAGSGNGGVSGAHGIERPRSVNSLDKPRGGSGNTGLGGVWGWPGSGVGAVGGGGGGGTRQQRESFDRNSRSYSLELSGRHGRCGQQVGRGGQGSGRGGGRGSSAGQSPLSYSSHAGGHHQHQRDHHTFGGGAGFPSRGGGGGTGFPSRGSSPALSSYARSSVAVEYEPPPPGQPPAGIVRAVAAGDAPCVPPTTDLQRLLAQVTPRLALDPSKPLGAALSELTLEDVWRFYCEPSLFGREVGSVGDRGPSTCYYVPYLSAMQIFTPAHAYTGTPAGTGGESRQSSPGQQRARTYVCGTDAWPRHMHLAAEHFESEMPYNRTALYDTVRQLAGSGCAAEQQQQQVVHLSAPSIVVDQRGGSSREHHHRSRDGAMRGAGTAHEPCGAVGSDASASARSGARSAGWGESDASSHGGSHPGSPSHPSGSPEGGEQPPAPAAVPVSDDAHESSSASDTHEHEHESSTAPSEDSADSPLPLPEVTLKANVAAGGAAVAPPAAPVAAAASHHHAVPPPPPPPRGMAHAHADSSPLPGSGAAPPGQGAPPPSGGCFLRDARVADLHPASWYAVAWYPVYRIPDAPLTTRFLTYHSFAPLVRQACAGPTPAADNGDDGESAGSCRVDGGEGCADAAGAPPEGDQQQQQVVGTELPIAAGEPPIATGEPPGEAAGAAGAEASLPPSPLLPTTVPLHVVGLQWCNLHGERWLDVPSAEGSGLAGGGNGHGGKRSAAQRHLDTQWFSYLGELQYTAAWLSHGRGLQLLGQMGGGDAEPGVRHPDFEFFSSRP